MFSSPQVGIDASSGSSSSLPLANPVRENTCVGATMFGCSSAFISGVLVVLLVEALLIMFIVLRALEKKKNPRPSTPHTSSVSVETPENSLLFSLQVFPSFPVGQSS